MSAQAPRQQAIRRAGRRIAISAPNPPYILATALAALPAVAVLAPKAAVPILLALAVFSLPGAWLRGWRPGRPSPPALVLAGAVIGWTAITSLWSFEPADGLSTLVRLVALVAFGWIVTDICARFVDPDAAHARLIARAVVAGLAAGTVVLIVELAFDMPIKRALTWEWAADALNPSETNRGGTLLAVLCWIAIPILPKAVPAWRVAAVSLLTGVAVAIAIGESRANQVGLAAGVGGFAVAWLGARVRKLVWAGAITLGLLASPWVAQGLFDAGLHADERVGFSVQHRVHIWNHVGQWALEKPWFGWGYDSSADFPNRGVEPLGDYKNVIPLHPHNAGLQVWLETGVVGVVLALAVLLMVARSCEAGGAGWTPWYTAAALTAFVIADTGYGIWQTQWIASLAWVACYARTAAAIAPDGLHLRAARRAA